MADNTLVQQGATFTVATDVIDGAAYQRVKVTYGADGAATDTSADAPFPAYDPQASGWRDDGHESGVVRYQQANADFVSYPFRVGHQYPRSIASASSSFAESGAPTNPDGTGKQFNISVPAGTNGHRLYYPFTGRGFGVRFSPLATTPDFSVAVDSEWAQVQSWPAKLALESITTELVYPEARAVTHDHLHRGFHLAELLFPAPASGTSTWVIFGWLLDRGAGYTEQPRNLIALTPTALTTSDVAISLATGVTGGVLRGLRKIIYANTTASPITVTVKTASGGTVLWSRPVPANDSIEFDPGGSLAMGYYHTASATGVNATVIGGY